jgi:RimJ/RimL family protein N-acetyltransferase
LETPRLILRRFTDADEPLLLELDSDPEVMRYINGGTPPTAQQIRDGLLEPAFRDYAESDRWGVWAALLKPSDEFIGWFHFWPSAQPPHDPEVGYRLKRAFWGRGLATEGTRAIIRKGFEEFRLPRIVARTLAMNAASRRVLEKAGMQYVCEADFVEHRFPGAPAGVWYEIRNENADDDPHPSSLEQRGAGG